jgi:hypothetical protein
METVNITLKLPKRMLAQVKRLAARRQQSISSLLTETLSEIVQRESGYAQARQRHLAWLEQAACVGTKGRPVASREALHER